MENARQGRTALQQKMISLQEADDKKRNQITEIERNIQDIGPGPLTCGQECFLTLNFEQRSNETLEDIQSDIEELCNEIATLETSSASLDAKIAEKEQEYMIAMQLYEDECKVRAQYRKEQREQQEQEDEEAFQRTGVRAMRYE